MNLTLRYGTFGSPFPLRRRWQTIGAVKRNFESLAFFGLACAMKAALCEWAGSFPNHNSFKAGPGAHAQQYEWFGQLCFLWVCDQREQMGRSNCISIGCDCCNPVTVSQLRITAINNNAK